MELRVLKYFLMVAREENITKAAKLLHITQPTLSRQITQMEEELGVTLFHRSRYKIVLTAEGRLLRQRAQEIVLLTEKTERELRQEEDAAAGEISIGCGETLENMECLAKVIASFQQIYPKVTFDIFTGIADDVKERMEDGVLHFGMLIEPVDLSKYSFIRMPKMERWTVLMRADHRLADSRSVSPADLAGEAIIMPKRPSLLTQMENWFGRHYGDIHPVVTMNLSTNNKSIFVEQGVGLALGMDFEVASPLLRIKPLNPPINVHCVLAWKKNQFLPSIMAKFIEHAELFFRNGESGKDLGKEENFLHT